MTARKKHLMPQVAAMHADGRQRGGDQTAVKRESYEQIRLLNMQIEWLNRKAAEVSAEG